MPTYLAGSVGIGVIENSPATINSVNRVGNVEQFSIKASERVGSGIGSISGTVLTGATAETGVAASVWVYLFDELSGLLVDAVLSSAIDGSYTFIDINRSRKHVVVAAAPNGSSYNNLLFAKVTPS